MFFARKLEGTEKEWEFFRGETRIIHDFKPTMGCFFTSSHKKTWKIEDKNILDYSIMSTPIMLGHPVVIIDDGHVFKALKPGTTFAICTLTQKKILVKVHDCSTLSRTSLFISIFRKMLRR